MKYTKKLRGKLAKIIATKEQLTQIGLGNIKEISTSSLVRIVGKFGYIESLGDIVSIGDNCNYPDYLAIPLKWLKIIEQ